MAVTRNRLAAATAVAAAFSMLAVPVSAAELLRPATVKAYDGEALNVEGHRRRYRDNDIDVSDVIAGVVLIGAISAIAKAASGPRDRDRYETRYPYPEPDDGSAGYRAPAEGGRYSSRGIERAVDICVGEVERGSQPVGSIDAATRSADGWHVSGVLESGAPYACTIGNDGRVSEVFVGDNGDAYEGSADEQYSDEYYAAARAGQGYPGDDGRYEASRAPDFEP